MASAADVKGNQKRARAVHPIRREGDERNSWML